MCSDRANSKTNEASKGIKNINWECPLFRLLGYCHSPLSETMSFSINERYNGKTGTVVNIGQLQFRTEIKNRESSNFVFLFSQLSENGHSLFSPKDFKSIPIST